MLIDGGNRDYSSFVVSYLKEQGVEELAYVIASHYDADHLNGVVGALHAFSCGQVLAPDYVTDTRETLTRLAMPLLRWSAPKSMIRRRIMITPSESALCTATPAF